MKAEAESVPFGEFGMAQLVMTVFQEDPVVETAVLAAAVVRDPPWDLTDAVNVDGEEDVVEVAWKNVQQT